MKHRICGLSLFALMLAFATATAAAPTLTFKFTHPFVPQTRFTTTVAINNAGVIAGRYIDNFGDTHGMILNGSKLTTVDRLDCLPTDNVVFTGINNKNVVAGTCLNFNDHAIGFVWAKGKFVDLKIPGAFSLTTGGINDLGWVVGGYVDSNGVQHGFLWNGKTFKTLDVPGADTGTLATGINNKGEVTLTAAIPNGFPQFVDSFLFNGKTYKKINLPGNLAINSFVQGINNLGDIIYVAFGQLGAEQAVLFHKGQFFPFTDGSQTTFPTGINDKLTMVGGDQDPNMGWEATTTP
jgi:probable HAF family extracellular repeat protein